MPERRYVSVIVSRYGRQAVLGRPPPNGTRGRHCTTAAARTANSLSRGPGQPLWWPWQPGRRLRDAKKRERVSDDLRRTKTS